MTSGDLHAELSKAFLDSFHFQGNSHHFNKLASAPNSGLAISGIGAVKLPLGKRAAKSIVTKRSKQLKRMWTSLPADEPVSIPSSEVSFTNVQWTEYVEGVAAKTVLPVLLGVSAANVPKMCLQLLRLSVHRPGSSTLPDLEVKHYLDTYGYITFVLPSQFEGGQFNIMRRNDMAPIVYETCNKSTSMLACYSHVDTTVQPVTAGYRLSLTYAIIHDCPNTPLPCMPTLYNNVRDTFRTVLKKWKDNKYTKVPKIPLVACVLRGEASDATMGLKGLDKRDAAIVNLLLSIAKSVDISVFTANLSKKIEGLPRKDHFASAGGGYDFDDDDEDGKDLDSYLHGDYDTPEMGKVQSEVNKLSCLKPVEEGTSAMTIMDKFLIKKNNLVTQGEEFDEPDEDDDDFDRDSGTVIHQHYRSVVVFARPEDETDIMLTIKGPYWCLKQLKVTTTPTARTLPIVSAAAKKLGEKRDSSLSFLYGDEVNDAAKSILAHALAWKQHALWNTAIAQCQGLSVQEISAVVAAASKVFKVNLLKEGLVSLIKSTTALGRRFDLVNIVSSNDGKGSSKIWLEELMQEALSSCTKPTVEDVPALVSNAKSKGPESILSIISKIDTDGTYCALMTLAKALHELCQDPTTPVSSKDTLTDAVHQCVSAATPQWESSLYANGWRTEVNTGNDKTKRICDIVSFCHTIDHLQPCLDLLSSLCEIEPDADATYRFMEIHAPLCFHLQATLKQLGKPVYSEPFTSFYRSSISLYLSRVLGAKLALPSLPTKPIGCGCANCMHLDQFLRGTRSDISYRAPHSRIHVQEQIHKENAVLDKFVTTDTENYCDGPAHTLFVRKRPEVMSALKWDERKAAALVFIKCVCPDDDSLRQLMGARYDDVMSAVQGTKVFVPGSLDSGSHATPVALSTTVQGGTKRSSGAADTRTADMKRQRVQ